MTTIAGDDDIRKKVAEAVSAEQARRDRRDWKWFDVQDETYCALNALTQDQALHYSDVCLGDALDNLNKALQAFLRGCGRSYEEESVARIISELRLPVAQASVRVRDIREMWRKRRG